jgi:hypothetical protein
MYVYHIHMYTTMSDQSRLVAQCESTRKAGYLLALNRYKNCYKILRWNCMLPLLGFWGFGFWGLGLGFRV